MRTATLDDPMDIEEAIASAKEATHPEADLPKTSCLGKGLVQAVSLPKHSCLVYQQELQYQLGRPRRAEPNLW
jgi:hypothetical protein